MKKVAKKYQITNSPGDIIELTRGETIKVTWVSESKLYLEGVLHGTPKRDIYDTGVRQTDKLGIKE